MKNYILQFSKDILVDENRDMSDTLFEQYEAVIIQSLITSFGLDIFIKDNYGGDVDTPHNAEKIGNNSNIVLKNEKNKNIFENRGEYNSKLFHSDKTYKEVKKENKIKKQQGKLKDNYTGKYFDKTANSDLDHIVSAKENFNNAANYLYDGNPLEIANIRENFNETTQNINRSKKECSIEEFLNRNGDKYTEKEKSLMKLEDEKARKAIRHKNNMRVINNKDFHKDVLKASSSVGIKMGIRQVLGFIFVEIWQEIKEEFKNFRKGVYLKWEQFKEVFKSIGNGIKRGLNNARLKYKDLISKFFEGAISGVISSIFTTITNFFFTTAKNVVKIIRESFCSLVQATKILFFKKDFSLEERLKEASKIIVTGASVIVGALISELVSKTSIGQIPIVGEVVQIFCGTFVTGILSCTLIYIIENSEIIQKAFNFVSSLFESESVKYARQAVIFEEYFAKLSNLDIAKFKQEIAQFERVVNKIENIEDSFELNIALKEIIKEQNIQTCWQDDFDSFISNKNNVLRFE